MTYRRYRVVLGLDLEVVISMRRESERVGLAEDVCEVVILRRKVGEVGRRRGRRAGTSLSFGDLGSDGELDGEQVNQLV